MRACREIPLFLLASLALCAVVFGDALWGRSITAPVDIAPALWTKFSHVDPASTGIPQNHHIVDQLSYDLPLQWTIHQAYRRGEIPWWDPYTYGGRPLLADAHCNGADPVRVLMYLAVPDFVLAYNWTLVAHHLVLGLGMFVLLRRLGSGPLAGGALALAFQIAGAFVLHIGHPWVTAAFSWYPWLWVVWHGMWEKPRRWHWLAAPALVAAIFYAGNLQSHAYLPVFALCFVAGYAGRSAAGWGKGLLLVSVSGIVGAMIAAPILGPEIELYLLSDRTTESSELAGNPWDGPLAFAAIWPWALGTFRTVTYLNLGFYLFSGPLVMLLALAGLRPREGESLESARARRVALWSVLVVLVILSTPLCHIFYRRVMGLGMLGLTVLAALGFARIGALAPERSRRLAMGVAIVVLLIAAGTFAVTQFIYPKLRPKIEERMVAHAKIDIYGGRALKLRQLQAANYPAEVGLGNPEVLVALLTLAAAALALRRPALLPLLLLANVASPALFARRFIPRQPVALWERLRDGSSEQRSVVAQVGRSARFRETAPGFERVFPFATAHFFGLHVVDGYAALRPISSAQRADIDPNMIADWTRDSTRDELMQANPNGAGRFQWRGAHAEPIHVESQGLNRLTVHLTRDTGGALLRKDTFHPGWRAFHDSSGYAVKKDRVFSNVFVPQGSKAFVLEYSPSGLGILLAVSAVGLASACLLSSFPRRKDSM